MVNIFQKSSTLYLSVLYALLLPLHIMNTMEVGGVKLWYFPVLLLACIGLFYLKKLKSIYILRLLFAFLTLSFISAIIGGVEAINNSINLSIIILALFPLWGMNKTFIYRLFPFLFIVAIYFSFVYANWENANFRFQGMYNDPNYLCTSLVVGIYFCSQNFSKTPIVIKVVSLVAIVYAIYTIMFTQSRGGIIALLCICVFIILRYYKSNKIIVISSLIILMFSASSIYLQYAENIDNIVSRFSGEKESDRSSADSRLKEINSAFSAIEDYPLTLVLGGGFGVTGKALDYTSGRGYILPYKYNNTHRIHNTYVAVFFEQGVFAFFIFMIMLAKVGLSSWRTDKVKFGLLLSLSLQAMTIWVMPYLPFWLAYVICADENQ